MALEESRKMVNDTINTVLHNGGAQIWDWQLPRVVACYFGMPQLSLIDLHATGLDVYSSSQVGKS